MTTTEEAAKLAKKLASKCAEASYRRWNIDAVIDVDAVEKDVLPILTAAFAERDEELKRLREENEECRLLLLEARSVCQSHQVTATRFEEKVKAALQYKEPNNES